MKITFKGTLAGTTKSYLAGGLVFASALSLYQDYLGPEGYAELVVEQWISPVITVPLAIVVLLSALYVHAKEGKKERELNSLMSKFLGLPKK
jgi:hypothetical protein